MPTILEQVRELEEAYYEGMPIDVSANARLRDEGIRFVREAPDEVDVDIGTNMLARSVKGLRWAFDLYKREYFASLYMQARGEFLAGEYDYAGDRAAKAMQNLPSVPHQFEADIIADQYVAIASGRLSLILSTARNGEFPVDNWEDSELRRLAIESARLARQTCRHSEDRSKMIFADGAMSEAERKTARKRHTISAAAATAGLWLPHGAVMSLAKKVM